MRGHAGTLFLDIRYWVAVSRDGHHWITNNPDEARQRGLLCQRGDWGRQGPGPQPTVEEAGNDMLYDNRGWDGQQGTV